MTPRICPRCGNEYLDFPVVSIRDNKTEICQTCKQAEILLKMINKEDEPWFIDKNKSK